MSETVAAVADSRAPTSAARPDRIGRFVILDELGAGGMGVVYAAWDPSLDRRVALKLVLPHRQQTDAHGRLLREAQAMAKLAHPNVVTVFEVGSHEGSVWIAMEFVDGATLRGALQEQPRGWTEILALFRQAGEGLAAAHAAGLVHRDFKPDNVLIGRDGRARVADFGLVRPLEHDERGSQEDLPASGDDGGSVVLDPNIGVDDPTLTSGAASKSGTEGQVGTLRSGAPLTAAGTLLGTPRYMAPEQFRRQAADARSDQFAFCVALYEALYGEPPFAGKRLIELAAAVTLGEPRTPPRDSPVPAKIARAIMRGLAREPDDRHRDMPTLLAELEVEPASRRWPLAVASLAVAGLAAFSAAWFAREPTTPADPCAIGREQIAEVWGPTRRAEIAARFDEVAKPFARTSLAAVDDALNHWTGRWADTYAGACATRHEQSAELYDLRMACLSRHRQEVGQTVALLADADAELVRDAPELVTKLPELAACDDVEQLRAVDPPAPEIADEVASLGETVARLRARFEAGRLRELDGELAPVRERVEALGYAPLQAEFALLDGQVLDKLDRDEQALTALLRSHELALASGDDRLALVSATSLISFEARASSKSEQLLLARRWNLVATGLARRLGAPVELEVQRRIEFGSALAMHAAGDEAAAELAATAALAEQQLGSDSLLTAKANLRAARAHERASRFAQAREYLDRAVAGYERLLSPDHPLLVGPLSARVSLNRAAGQLDDALADAQRVLAISEAAYGSDHSISIDAIDDIATIQDLRGDHRGARAMFETLLERRGEAERLRSDSGVMSSNSLCFTLYKLGEYAEARRVCERILAEAPAIVGADHVVLAIVLNNLGLIARAEGELEQALALDRRAQAIAEASVGPDHVLTAYSLIGVGEALILLGRGREAVALLERALRVREDAGDPGELGEARCLLGRARGGADGRALIEAGLAELGSAGPNWSPQVAACEAALR